MNVSAADEAIQVQIRRLFDLGYPTCEFSQDAAGETRLMCLSAHGGTKIICRGSSVRDALGRAVARCASIELRGGAQ